MQVSPEGRSFLESFEGLSLKAYLCPAGVWTIGYGHTQGVKSGETMTKEEADHTLTADLVVFAHSVEVALGGAATNQHEFDAMVSLAFNIGIAGFTGSTVLRCHKAGDHTGAARAFGLWNKALIDGRLQSVPGLTRRRAAESVVYLTPVEASHPMPTPVAVEPQSMPQKVEKPQDVPTGYTETPSGNIVLEDVNKSDIVKAADTGTKIATVAGTVATAAPTVAAVAGMDWKLMLGVAAVILAGGLAFAVYKLVQAKTSRITMSKNGVA